MKMLFRLLIFAVLLFSFNVLHAETVLPDSFSNELDAENYDCLLALQPDITLKANHLAIILLESGQGSNRLRLEIEKKQLRIIAEKNQKRSLIGNIKSAVAPGEAYLLTVIRRGTSLALLHGNSLLFQGNAPRGSGVEATAIAESGWTIKEASVQRQEPVIFADDFMREANDKGLWVQESGQWALQSAWDAIPNGKSYSLSSSIYAQNPFAWVGRAVEKQAAICTAGDTNWDNYTLAVSVQPAAVGAVGVLVNVADAQNRLLLRWSPANDHGVDGKQLTLYKIIDGKQTLIAKSPGGYLPGQWYRIAVISSLTGVKVLVDGRKRIDCKWITRWRGAVGLYVEGADGAIFDDLTVYGAALDTDLLAEIRQSRIGQRFRDDQAGMKEWSVSPDLWQADETNPELFWHPDTLYGNKNRICATVKPPANALGELTLMLYGDRSLKLESGYRAVIAIAENAQQTISLYRGTQLLASKNAVLLLPDEESTLALAHIGTQLILEIDDEAVLQADDLLPLSGGSAAYYRKGKAFASLHDIEVYSHNMLDYTFTEAPVDWYSVGTWEPSVRWSCQPQWSFLGGWSRSDAVLWHKQRFIGDQSLQAYLAVQMEYPREREVYMYTRHSGFFGITICGDGKNPRNGYSAIYGAPDKAGTPYQRAVLLRNGVEVASVPITAHAWSDTHRAWFVPSLTKEGAVVSYRMKIGKEQITLSYTDPDPISDGVPAVWTNNNAISVARVRLNNAAAKVPWAGPQVNIDFPWYPEWANVGQTDSYSFPNTCSLRGKPVTLQVLPQDVPAADKNAATVHGLAVQVTPQSSGEHWYSIVANDGINSSQPFNLEQKVFNPALQRDDSHALVLYRFDEGSGKTVHDKSNIAPPIDLEQTGDENPARWLPGQGMIFQRNTLLQAPGEKTEKLMAVAKAKACTIELWLSSDSMIWGSNLLWWGENANAANFSVRQTSGYFMAVTRAYVPNQEDFPVNQFYTSLHHYAITWDGTTTTAYRDSEQLWQKTIDWAPDRWIKNSPLVLGQSFAGTYYLAAIHDRCLSKEDITQHYQAGPSAK